MLAIMEALLYGKVSPHLPEQLPSGGFNISPTDQVSMIRWDGDCAEITSARWQIKDPRGRKPLINSKIENVSFWKDYWDNGRCLVPALGYYEWPKGQGHDCPVFISVKSNSPTMFFAGFYRTEDGRHSCSIMTRNPSSQIAHIHSRMPVILTPEEIEDWLTGVITPQDAQVTLGTKYEGRFEHHTVKPIKPGANGEELVT
ncbi:SOS response-associated peptidase, partial [Roseibium sp. RKSG952]|uniref:SOS response-associated peptidase n=1 Tax=Roseibium sp. RKSG952 TaxID=2529384 RepID=UPI001FCCAB5E